MHGNVEHFSICSEDSIWHEPDANERANTSTRAAKKYDYNDQLELNDTKTLSILETKQTPLFFANDSYPTFTTIENRKFLVSNGELRDCSPEEKDETNLFAQNANKYKNNIIEKYLRDCQRPENYLGDENEKVNSDELTKPSMISKWLESAANFRPSENNYLNWTLMNAQRRKSNKRVANKLAESCGQQHGKEELDAAEALTRLASANVSIKL